MSSIEPNTASHPTVKTSASAIWSLVLGILSFCLSIFAAIPAIILGIVAIKKIDASQGILAGKGLAVAGLVLGAIGLVLSTVWFAAALPAYQGIQERAVRIKLMTELKMIGIACSAYAADHEGAFPPKLADLEPGYIDDQSFLVAEQFGESGTPYLYRGGLSSTSSPSEPLAMTPAPVDGIRTILYVDGSTDEIPEEEIGELLRLFDSPLTPE